MVKLQGNKFKMRINTRHTTNPLFVDLNSMHYYRQANSASACAVWKDFPIRNIFNKGNKGFPIPVSQKIIKEYNI